MRSVGLSCGDVQLKLTLASHALPRPFKDVVVLPFLNALHKRAAQPHSTALVRHYHPPPPLAYSPLITHSQLATERPLLTTHIPPITSRHSPLDRSRSLHSTDDKAVRMPRLTTASPPELCTATSRVHRTVSPLSPSLSLPQSTDGAEHPWCSALTHSTPLLSTPLHSTSLAGA